MFRIAAKLSIPSFSSSTAFVALTATKSSLIYHTRFFHSAASLFKSYDDVLELDKSMARPDVIRMMNYAMKKARSDKSVGSYGLGMLVLDHCLTTELTIGNDPKAENSKGIALLALSTLLSERGEYVEAIENLKSVQELTNSHLCIRVAAFDAQVGLHLELGQDAMASALAEKCIELAEKQETGENEGLTIHAKALKGLTEIVNGDIKSAEALFDKSLRDGDDDGSAGLLYGEFLQTTHDYSTAREVYWNVIQGVTYRRKKGGNSLYLGAGNMNLEGLMVGAMCALGQLESHLGKFGHARDRLRKALNSAEETYGDLSILLICSTHPKVGVVLTSIALMYRRKAIEEHSSSLLIQEGLYRRLIDILKVPAVETESEGAAPSVDRSDMAALARGAYAEVLSVQENRKDEGEKMKNLAESIWRNHRMTLDDALGNTESNISTVMDARIRRLL